MLAIGFLLTWAAYGTGSWGYCLLRGWNITARSWFSPLHPYQFPPSGAAPPLIPQGKVWPVGGPSESSGTIITPDNPGGLA